MLLISFARCLGNLSAFMRCQNFSCAPANHCGPMRISASFLVLTPALVRLRLSLHVESLLTCLCTPLHCVDLFSVTPRSFTRLRVILRVLACFSGPSHASRCFNALPCATARLVTPSRPPRLSTGFYAPPRVCLSTTHDSASLHLATFRHEST